MLAITGVLTFFGLGFGARVVTGPGSTSTVTRTVTTTVTTPGPTPNSPVGSKWLSDLSNPSNNNFASITNQPVTVGGQTYPHTVQLINPQHSCSGDPSSISFPVPSGATQLSGNYGWTSDSSGASDQLLVYANSLSGTLLWSQSFTNPGLPLTSKSLDNIAGAHAVIFEFTGMNCDTGTFVLADAQFTP